MTRTTMQRASADRSPVHDLAPLVMIAAVITIGLGAPILAATVLSSTGWRPTSLFEVVDTYLHLGAPDQIDGSGLTGPWFAVLTGLFATAGLIMLGVVAARVQRPRRDELRGLATRQELQRFSARSIIDKSEVILGHHDTDPTRAGWRAGRCVHTHMDVWLPKESTLLVLAPPRSGKTSGTVAPMIVDHHGPVVATGVRSEILNWTHAHRAARGGPLWLCEPMLPADAHIPDGVQRVRWSPVAGCEDYVTAQLRAEVLFAAIPKGGANDEYWRNAGEQLLAGYLMAAAHGGDTILTVLDWVDRDSDDAPADVLRWAADQVDDEIDAHTLRSAASQLDAAIAQDPRYKAGVTGQVTQALAPFRLPEIRRMCAVPAAESFDPVRFLAESGTIWMLGSESHQRRAAGVCTALTAQIVESARALARAAPHGRLRPPLLLALDEAVNVAPIPRLEQLLSTGGGSGIQTVVVLQSLAAARNVWGAEMGDALLDFNNAKIVLGGLGDASDLQDLSTLLGQREERVVQASRSHRMSPVATSDYQFSWRQVPVMRPDEIRQIDSDRAGHALFIARNTRGVLIEQDRIFDRPQPRHTPRRHRHTPRST